MVYRAISYAKQVKGGCRTKGGKARSFEIFCGPRNVEVKLVFLTESLISAWHPDHHNKTAIMPKAPSTFGSRRTGGAGPSGPSSSSSGGPKFSSAAPSRETQGSLASQLRKDDHASRFGSISQPGRRIKKKGRRQGDDDESDEEIGAQAGSSASSAAPSSRPFVTGGRAGGGATGSDKYVDKRLSSKILRLAREQQDEIEREEEEAEELGLTSRMQHRGGSGAMPDDDQDGAVDGAGSIMSDDDGELPDGGDSEEEFEYEEVEVDPEDAELLERMRADRMGATEDGGGRRTLADLIMDKIEAAGAGQATDGAAGSSGPDENGMVHGMNPKIVEVYTK